MTFARFPVDVVAAARASRTTWGPPASVTLAQWALESAFGAHLSGKCNPFGIKARPGELGTPRKTWEALHGERIEVVQTFRDFSSIAEAFDAHGRLLATGSAYGLARLRKGDPKAYARALTGRYATDPLYGDKLVSIMDAHNLYAADDPARPADIAIPVASNAKPPHPALVAAPGTTSTAGPWQKVVDFLRRINGKAA